MSDERLLSDERTSEIEAWATPVGNQDASAEWLALEREAGYFVGLLLNDREARKEQVRTLREALASVECAHPHKVIEQYDNAGDEFHYEDCGRCGSCRARATLEATKDA